MSWAKTELGTGVENGTATITFSPSAQVNVGDLLLFIIGEAAAVVTSSGSDNSSQAGAANTYAVDVSNTTNGSCQIVRCVATRNILTTDTVSIVLSGIPSRCAWTAEKWVSSTGVGATPLRDSGTNNNAFAGAITATTSGTAGLTGDLVVVASCTDTAGATATAGTGYTMNTQKTSGNLRTVSPESKTATADGSQAGTINFPEGRTIGAVIAVYAAAPGVAFDAASTSAYQAAVSSYSWSHTCTGSNLAILVGVSVFAAGTVTGITYNGVALTKERAVTNGLYRSELWYLSAPATGSHTIAVTLSASLTSIANAVSYTGVNQATPVDLSTFATGTGNPISKALTPPTDKNMVVDVVSTSDTAITVHAGQTSRANNTGALGSGTMSDQGPVTPAAATTMQWDNVGVTDTWAQIVASLDDATDANVYEEPGQDATIQFCANGTDTGVVEIWNRGSHKSSSPVILLL